jgi:hypothetical protein
MRDPKSHLTNPASLELIPLMLPRRFNVLTIERMRLPYHYLRNFKRMTGTVLEQ